MLRPTPIGKLKRLPCCLFQAGPQTEKQGEPGRVGTGKHGVRGLREYAW